MRFRKERYLVERLCVKKLCISRVGCDFEFAFPILGFASVLFVAAKSKSVANIARRA